jgi:hypothetical protein
LADYTITWADIPLEQYWALPEQARQHVNARILELRRDPTANSENYNPDTDHWTVDYGGGAGLLVYAAVPDRQRIIILRLIDLT